MISEYPWLERVWGRLIDAHRQSRLPHALLLTGHPGMGKAVLADDLARFLLCERPVGGAAACRKCTGCTLFAAGSHPDYFRIAPADDSRAIRIDQVRELAEGLALTSHGNGYKVAVLKPADALNINAANGLLKTLEEPTDNTVLVLVSGQPARLPATIRSRCQEVRLKAPDRELTTRWLASQVSGVSPEVYLALANGAPLQALQLAQEHAVEERQQRFRALLAIREGREDPLAVAADWATDADLKGLRWMRQWLMDMLKIRLTGQVQGIHGIDLLDGLSMLAQKLDSRVVFGQLDGINGMLRLADSTLNRQMMMEDILLAWADQASRDDMDQQKRMVEI
jgi:DNA polymerase-3 subunit delta'